MSKWIFSYRIIPNDIIRTVIEANTLVDAIFEFYYCKHTNEKMIISIEKQPDLHICQDGSGCNFFNVLYRSTDDYEILECSICLRKFKHYPKIGEWIEL